MVRRIIAWLLSALLVVATDWLLTPADEWNILKSFRLAVIISTLMIAINWYQQRSKKKE